MTSPQEGVLERELRGLLAERNVRYDIFTNFAFLDLLWDPDFGLENIMALDLGVVVDALHSPRRLVLQRVREELRYWLTTDRAPVASEQNELGVLASLEDATALCEEFLNTSTGISELKTPRIAGGVRRGEWPS